MRTTTINARIDNATKNRAVHILKELGMNPSQAISLFFKQIIYTRGIPFELKVPSRRSLETMAKVDAGTGLHEVADADELLKELNS